MLLRTMNGVKIYSVLFFSALFLIIVCALSNYKDIERYALNNTQNRFGSMRLSQEQEEKINAIATQMNVAQPFIMRKMNNNALKIFGYCNAFVYFPKWFDIIPLSTTAFLFVSEGFFEDLSPEEQRFVIGHEMIHAKEQHLLYLNLVRLFVWWLIVALYWLFVRKYGKNLIARYIVSSHAKNISLMILSIVVMSASMSALNVIRMAYMRHIEWQADERSLKILESYDGCCKLMDRWEKEFNIPQHNPYGGWFSDHPSCFERKQYCLTLKNKSKEQNELSKKM